MLYWGNCDYEGVWAKGRKVLFSLRGAFLLQPPSCDLPQTLPFPAQLRSHARHSRLYSPCCTISAKTSSALWTHNWKVLLGGKKKITQIYGCTSQQVHGSHSPLYFCVDVGCLWTILAGVFPFLCLCLVGHPFSATQNFRRIHPRVYRIPPLIQVIWKWLKRLYNLYLVILIMIE